MFACCSGCCFIVTEVAFNKSGHLDQLNVIFEKVNETKGDMHVLAVTGRDETRCTVIKPLNNTMLRGCRVLQWRNTRGSEDGRVRKTQERRVEEDMGSIITVGKGGSKSESTF